MAEVAELLKTGQSEKQIASRMGVSQHTAHVYIRNTYRLHGVQSRAEYMAQFIQPTPHERLCLSELNELMTLSVRMTTLLSMLSGRAGSGPRTEKELAGGEEGG